MHKVPILTEKCFYFVLHCCVILLLFFLCFGLFYPQVFHFESRLMPADKETGFCLEKWDSFSNEALIV